MDARLQSGKTCYCCCTIPSKKRTVGMDLDAALSELGMLSTVSEGRRQYLIEKSMGRRMRTRNMSEPGANTDANVNNVCSNIDPEVRTSPASVSLPKPCTSNTISIPSTPYSSPQGSPSRGGGYQLLAINPFYVTSVCVNSSKSESDSICDSPVWDGGKYSEENLKRDARSNRLARVKLARLKRFQKPYDVPWRHSIEKCIGVSSSYIPAAPSTSFATPEKLVRPADKLASVSTASTPEKPSAEPGLHSVGRSRSLDELDFAKLRLAENENHNFILERKEIESVSHHLRKLQVNE